MLKILTERKSNEQDLLSQSLDELARSGAKRLLIQALELEVEEYIQACSRLRDERGRRQVVRNGKGRGRRLTVGSGTFTLEAPRVDDRREGFKFKSKILPPYMRKSPSVESVLPLLYLKGLSGNAFGEALKALLGEDAAGLSKSSIASLKRVWLGEFEEWKKQKIEEEFVYLWADGVNVNIRLGEDKKSCLLVVLGVTTEGKKKLLAVEGGYRESAENWRMLFRGLIQRGLNCPALIVGDGALGLWAAMKDIPEFERTKGQRCWVHKIANVLDKLPKRIQPRAKSLLHEMMNAPDKKSADESCRIFQKEFHEKYPKAADCLLKDWDRMTTFFSFPAVHWQHIRTTNPIESTFATVKLRTKSAKGAGNRQMAEVTAFKLMREAQKRWRKIRGFQEIQYLCLGRLYRDGKMVETGEEQRDVA